MTNTDMKQRLRSQQTRSEDGLDVKMWNNFLRLPKLIFFCNEEYPYYHYHRWRELGEIKCGFSSSAIVLGLTTFLAVKPSIHLELVDTGTCHSTYCITYLKMASNLPTFSSPTVLKIHGLHALLQA